MVATTLVVLDGNDCVCCSRNSFDIADKFSSFMYDAFFSRFGWRNGATVGCSAQMIGFAVMSFKENGWADF